MPQQQRKSSARKRTPTRTEIVRIPAPLERPWELNEEQVTILKNSICKGATDDELKYCLTVARRYRLDPFKQQIWFVPRNDKNADNPAGGKGMRIWTPTVGINGLLFAAARDHKAEFGSVSLPEFGPMVKRDYTYEYKGKTCSAHVMAPAWARVKVWKKGEPAPTEAEAWWEEYCPEYLNSAPFWRKMPRRMIGKCATALAIRQAYPDLGGIFIPEETDRIGEDYTPEGRQIVRREDQPVSPQLDENARHGHAEGSRQASMAEESLKRVEQADADFKKQQEEERKAIQAEGAEKASQIKPESQQPGDNEDIWPRGSVPSTEQVREQEDETNDAAAGAAPLVMAGTIEQANTVSGKSPSVKILLHVDKASYWLTAWNKEHFKALLEGKKQVAELYVEKRTVGKNTYTNIIGLKRVGKQRYEEDGKTPYTSTDREPGTRLF